MKRYVKAYYQSPAKSRSITQEVLDYCKDKYPNLYKELKDKDIWINMWSDGEYSLSYSLLKPEYYLSDSAADDLVKVMTEMYPNAYCGDVIACEDVTSVAKPKYFATMVNCSTGDTDKLTPREFLNIFTGELDFVEYDGNIYLIDTYHLGEPNWDYGIYDVIPSEEFFSSWSGDIPDFYVEGWFDFMINDELQNHYGIPGDSKVLDELDRNPISEWGRILEENGYNIPVVNQVSEVFNSAKYPWKSEKIYPAGNGEIDSIAEYNKEL